MTNASLYFFSITCTYEINIFYLLTQLMRLGKNQTQNVGYGHGIICIFTTSAVLLTNGKTIALQKKHFSIICFKGRTIAGSQLQLPVIHSCPFLHRHGLYAMSFLFIFLQLLFLCIYYIDGHILLFHFALL